jgi:hypothetical protein
VVMEDILSAANQFYNSYFVTIDPVSFLMVCFAVFNSVRGLLIPVLARSSRLGRRLAPQ